MFKIANDIIEKYLSENWTATEIDYDNVEFTPVRGTPFVRLQVEWTDSKIIAVGQRIRAKGYVDLSIFIPANTNVSLALTYADTLATMFNRYSSGLLLFESARISRIGAVNQWYQIKVLVPFEYTECL